MPFANSFWKELAGQKDVLPGLHVPMVYESIPAEPPVWEYHLLSVDVREAALPDEAVLNELGQQGWLLVSTHEQRMTENHCIVHYYFVRQK